MEHILSLCVTITDERVAVLRIYGCQIWRSDKIYKGFLLLSVWLIHGQGTAQTMSQAVQIALAQYPAILVAQAQADASDAEAEAASAQHWPQVSWQGTQSAYSSGLSSPLSPQNSWIQSPTVSMNIWSGWRIESEVERARAMRNVSQRQRQITEDEVALLALEGYLNWARTRRSVQLAQDNLAALQRIRNNIAAIVRIDTGRHVDLEQANVRVENAEVALRQRQTELELSRQRLSRMLQAPPPSAPSGIDVKFGVLPNDMREAVSSINDQHPIIAKQHAKVEAAKAGIRSAKSQFSPSVDLAYSKQVSQGTGQGDYLTQVTITMPIFSGGSSYSGLKAAHAQLQVAQFELQETQILQQEKLMQARSDWESAKTRAEVGKRQEKAGSTLVKGYEQQFQVGRRSLLDLLNVQNDLFTYQTNTLNAIFEEKISYARMLAVLGKLASAFK